MNPRALAWVVPCFDEANRLDGAAFLSLVESDPDLSLLFVDDGSRDDTLARLHDLANQRRGRIRVLALPRNQGKAEAVRQGMRAALADRAEIVGYVDADLATPPDELRRLASMISDGDYDLLMGSRVQLLGRCIERASTRHYVGRIFATCASLALGLPVYDTQCGAKLLRNTPALVAALEQPFTSRWAFDVELLARLTWPRPGVAAIDPHHIREEPLLAWRDVPGSKLRPLAALRSGIELAHIALSRRKR